MSTTKPLTANDMVAMLRRHYLPEGKSPAGFFAAEVGSPCGRRRADALWLPTGIAAGYGLTGHEIKVSRADLLVELGDPAKADPWAQYCDRWWLVVSDPKFIDHLDIPAAWGVMAPPSGRLRRSMTVIKPAPELHPMNPAPALRKLVSWQMWGEQERTTRIRYDLDSKESEIKRLRARIDDRSAAASGQPISPEVRRLQGLIETAKGRSRSEGLWWARFDDEDIVNALVDIASARGMAEDVQYRLRTALAEIDRKYDPLREAKDAAARAIRAELAALAKDAA